MKKLVVLCGVGLCDTPIRTASSSPSCSGGILRHHCRLSARIAHEYDTEAAEVGALFARRHFFEGAFNRLKNLGGGPSGAAREAAERPRRADKERDPAFLC